MNTENLEKIGAISDSIENILAATQLPLPANFHLNTIVETLKEFKEELREVYVLESGENPWEDKL